MTQRGMAAGLLLMSLWAWGWACEPKRAGGSYHLPQGWKLNPKRAQMLARSYPRFTWISVIAQDTDRKGWLLSTPHPRPQLPGDRSALSLLFRRSPMRSPLQPRRRKPKVRPSIGFSFVFRTSKPLELQLRLNELQLTSVLQLAQRTRAKATTYTLNFALARTGRSWRKQSFHYKQFRVMGRPNDKRRPNPFKLAAIQLWAWPSAPKSTATKGTGPSATLTLQGPFRILGKRKRRRAISRRPATRRATSRPTSAPTSRRAASKKAQPPSSRPTSRPAARAEPRPAPRRKGRTQRQ